MRSVTSFIAVGAMLALGFFVGGCSDDALGGMGGQIFGDMAAKTAGNMATGNAQKKAQQQQKQQEQAIAQQQQQQQQLQEAQQAAGGYQAPTLDMTGTLIETPATATTPAKWTFTPDGTNIPQQVQVTAVQKDARALTGKKVKITGRYDTLNTGAFVVEKVAAAPVATAR